MIFFFKKKIIFNLVRNFIEFLDFFSFKTCSQHVRFMNNLVYGRPSAYKCLGFESYIIIISFNSFKILLFDHWYIQTCFNFNNFVQSMMYNVLLNLLHSSPYYFIFYLIFLITMLVQILFDMK